MSEAGRGDASPVVEVWIARESLLDAPGVSARLARWLAPGELERRDRMASEGGRRQQLLTRAMQRELLSWSVPGVAPREWRFTTGPAGRPALAAPFDALALDFNIAHTQGLVAIAIARTVRVGVDVEALDQRVPLHVAPRYFSAREVQALHALPAAEQPRTFLRLWTLKEAYLKATGSGLGGGLDSMTFSFTGASIRFDCPADPRAASWRFHEFDPDGYLLSLACLGATDDPPSIRLREYPPESGMSDEIR